MELDQLKTFLTVAELGSISKAADQLYLTQASVRQRLKDLENKIGAPLFERRGRYIFVTQKGNAYIPYASKMVTIMEEAENALQKSFGKIEVITIATTMNFCTFILIPWLAQFRADHPMIEVNIKMDFSRPITDQVLNSGIDIGFVKGPTEHKSLEIYPVFHETVVPVVTADHPWLDADVVPVEWLNDQPIIVWEPFSSTWEGVEQWLIEHNIRINTVMELEQVETCKQMAQKGHGIAFIPDFTIEKELLAGQLGTFALDPPLTNGIQTDLIINRHRDQSTLVKEFVDFCIRKSTERGSIDRGFGSITDSAAIG